MDDRWLDELDELRAAVRDLALRLTAAERAREQQDAALALAIAQHPANGPAREPTRRHLRLLRTLKAGPPCAGPGKRQRPGGPIPGAAGDMGVVTPHRRS